MLASVPIEMGVGFLIYALFNILFMSIVKVYVFNIELYPLMPFFCIFYYSLGGHSVHRIHLILT